MNKRWMISFVVLVVGLNVYASGNSDKHTKALAAQTTATEQAGAPSAVEHSDEAAHAEQAATHTAEEAAHTQQQEEVYNKMADFHLIRSSFKFHSFFMRIPCQICRQRLPEAEIGRPF